MNQDSQSEGPYKFKDRLKYAATVGPGIPDGEEYFDLSPEIANMIYAAGRKAERERCAKIAEGYFHARGRVVAKAIRGGQDAE